MITDGIEKGHSLPSDWRDKLARARYKVPTRWIEVYPDRSEVEVVMAGQERWTGTPRGEGTEWQRQVSDDVHAVVWRDRDGIWQLRVSEPGSVDPRRHSYGDDTSVEEALGHADALIANPNYEPPHFLGNLGEDLEQTLVQDVAHDRGPQLSP